MCVNRVTIGTIHLVLMSDIFIHLEYKLAFMFVRHKHTSRYADNADMQYVITYDTKIGITFLMYIIKRQYNRQYLSKAHSLSSWKY